MISNRTLEEILANIRKVKVSDVVEVAKNITLDTIYFMTSNNA